MPKLDNVIKNEQPKSKLESHNQSAISKWPRLFAVLCGLGVICALVVRFYKLQSAPFVYYDEGMYLSYTQRFYRLLQMSSPDQRPDFWQQISILWHISLKQAKLLWFFLISLRGVIADYDFVAFPRWISAVSGLLTVFVCGWLGFLLTKQRQIGFLAALILAWLPTHIYYSRLGLQESFSTFLFVSGLVLFVWKDRLHWSHIASGVLMSCVFFTNYRMIIIPIWLFMAECVLAWLERRRFAIRKWVWQTVTFLVVVFGIGALDGGANTYINFAWMFRQADIAPADFHWLNIFSYPYYIWRLEGAFVFASLLVLPYLAWKKNRLYFFPLAMVAFHMAGFSVASEKGLRYLCVIYPLIAIAVAIVLYEVWVWRQQQKIKKVVSCVFLIGLAFDLIIKSVAVLKHHSDYQTSANIMAQYTTTGKILSSQMKLHQIFWPRPELVDGLPRSWRELVAKHKEGYEFIVIDPQAYVMAVQSENRFEKKLAGYLAFIRQNVRPIGVMSHFTKPLMERFVLDHNDHLLRSIEFLKDQERLGLNKMYIYRVKDCLKQMMPIIEAQQPLSTKGGQL